MIGISGFTEFIISALVSLFCVDGSEIILKLGGIIKKK